MRGNRPLTAALVAGAGVTILVVVLPFAQFAYDNPSLHLALETGEGLIAGLLAYLAVGRYRATRRLQDVALAWAFSVLAFVNLVLSAGPVVTEGKRPSGWFTWAALGLRFVAVGALCAGAFTNRRAASPVSVLLRLVGGVTVGVAVVVSLAASAADAWLAQAVDPLLAPDASVRPRLVGHPVVLGIQLLAVGLYTAAAVRFTRQALEEGDELLRWLGAGALLGAFARVHYFLFPSLYSNFVYTGYVLRLGSYLFFLVGAAREIGAYWHDQTRLAVVEERRRVARELHDGLAQELAFIRSQTAAMADGMAVPGMEQHLSAAAERAVAESRRAIEALAEDGGQDDEPLARALALAAEDVAGRAEARVEVSVQGAPVVSGAAREALVRVTREAATNAIRHGGATKVSLLLCQEKRRLRLTVTDDGTGFDPASVERGYGLRSMRERVEALGGTFRVRSEPGTGTTVEVELRARRGR